MGSTWGWSGFAMLNTVTKLFTVHCGACSMFLEVEDRQKDREGIGKAVPLSAPRS